MAESPPSASSPGAPAGSYGIDAPHIVGTFVALTIMGVAASGYSIGVGQPGAAVGPLIALVLFGGTAYLMIRSSRVGKVRVWNELLDRLDLAGTEDVLDLGCGRGLVTAMAAARLPQGSAVGVDIWRAKDQSGNSRDATEANMVAAEVEDRVEIVDANMTELPYEDGTFDVVLASLAIHNLALARDRTKALDEIVRVLAPGGRIVILDIAKTNLYTDHFEATDLVDVDHSKMIFSIYPPARTVTARRKGASSAKPLERNKQRKKK